MGQKLRNPKPEELPGPGNYESKADPGKSFKIGKKVAQPKALDVPGPGRYRGHTDWAPGFGYEVDYEIEYIPDYELAREQEQYED